MRVSRRRAGCGSGRRGRRSSDHQIVGTAGVLDQRQEDASHVREQDTSFRNCGAPLHLHGVGAIDPLGGIFHTPADQRDAGTTGIVDDPQCLIAALRYCTNDVLNDDEAAADPTGGVLRIPMWRKRY